MFENENLNRKMSFVMLLLSLVLSLFGTVIMFTDRSVTVVEKVLVYESCPTSGIMPLFGTMMIGLAFYLSLTKKHSEKWILFLIVVAEIFLFASFSPLAENHTGYIGWYYCLVAELSLVFSGIHHICLINREKKREKGESIPPIKGKRKKQIVPDAFDPIWIMMIVLLCIAILLVVIGGLLAYPEGVYVYTGDAYHPSSVNVAENPVMVFPLLGMLFLTGAVFMVVNAKGDTDFFGGIIIGIMSVQGILVAPFDLMESSRGWVGYWFFVSAAVIGAVVWLLSVLYLWLADKKEGRSATEEPEKPIYMPEGAERFAEALKLIRQAKELFDRGVFSPGEYHAEKLSIFRKYGIRIGDESEK